MGVPGALAVALVLACGIEARAAEAIFYSDPEQYYGWAAGYSYSRAEAEARSQCETSGSDCQLAVECDGGWGAVAFADDPVKGVGMSCGMANPGSARQTAIAECVIASNALCWTESVFDNSGNEFPSDRNLPFDTTWYVQQMLNALPDIDVGTPDGTFGAKTREGVLAFQRLIGREPTGEVDNELFWRLVDAVQGAQSASDGLRKARERKIEDGTYSADHGYGYSSAPAAKLEYSVEVASRSDEDRRSALSTLLNVWGHPCTVPAKRVEALPADGSGFWAISCEEGDFTIAIDIDGKGSHLVANGLYTLTESGDGRTTVEPPAEPSGEAGEPPRSDP